MSATTMSTMEEGGSSGPSFLENTSLHAADIAVIVGYFVIVMAFGLWSSLRNRGSVGGYFLAGRSMHWIPVGASLFASNIGSGHFIGLAGSGAASGIGIAGFELNALFVLLILGWIFVPVYIAAGVYTMPEYLRKRFGGQRIRIYLSVLALLLSIFTKVAADLFAGATFIKESLKWNLYVSIVILLAIAAVFTISGGLTAVIWTDFIQTVIMLIGAAVLMVIGFVRVGGYNSLVEQFMRSFPNSTRYHKMHPEIEYNYTQCGIPTEYSMHMFRPADDPGLPWTGMTFGLTISAVWYWCSDQVIVQRALAAKDLSHAKAGCIMAGYLKILPMFLLVIPGMMSRVLFPDRIGCADPEACEAACGSPKGCTNLAYPYLVLELMPTGAKGLMLAVMIAALMSSLTSIFNSSSTIFTMDIWRRIHKDASDTELMIVGRVFVLFMVAIGIVWIPIVQGFAELFHYIQSITSYLAPPVCAVYVLAVLWKRCNEQGAFWSLMIGLVVGLIRFIWEFSYTVPACGEGYKDKRPWIISKVHYLHFGIILFCITCISCIIISLLTEPIDDKYNLTYDYSLTKTTDEKFELRLKKEFNGDQLHRLTFWSKDSDKERVDIDVEDEKKEKVKKNKVSGQDNPAMNSKDVTLNTTASEMTIEMTPPAPLPCWKKSLLWICGIEKHEELEMTDEQKRALAEKQTSLYELPKWRRLCNINAILLMIVAIFFYGFFY